MPKHLHEIRDPIHVFVRLDSDERAVLNSEPFQRLRYVHQLALTYLIYPGATHRRFEHSLGVMELATRIYDVVTDPNNVTESVKESLPELTDSNKRSYWKRVLRMAALCHDMGHLPFSHAAEDLLPSGQKHEAVSAAIIRSDSMKAIWEGMTPPLRTEDVVKVALGPKETKGIQFSAWESLVAEMIVGDAFGADRMDYLLRDSYHVGVTYGHFDHYRLIDTLRILPALPRDQKSAGKLAPELGVEEGGLHSAEALMLARYFMYLQVYFHPVRRIYNVHLGDFLRRWLPGGKFEVSVESYIRLTDNEIMAAIAAAARDSGAAGHDAARRLMTRDHFRLVYERNPNDMRINPRAGHAIFHYLKEQMGDDFVRHEFHNPSGGAPDFPVRMHDGRIISSISASKPLATLPSPAVDFVYVDGGAAERARALIEASRDGILTSTEEQDEVT